MNILRSISLLVLVAFLGSCTQQVNIKIVATTDVHGKLFPYNLVSGDTANYSLAQVYSYVKEQRTVENQEVILLDNGDILQGDPLMYYNNYVNDSVPHLQAKVMNFMGYDAATVGNHDIETGNKVFDAFSKSVNFPWMAANIKDTRTDKTYFQPYHIVKKKGVKVAVLSLTTPGVEKWVPDYNRKHMAFEDMVESAQYWINHIQKNEKPDFVVGLFHAGYDYTYGGGDSTSHKNENASVLVARAVDGFDAIIIGHDHKQHNKFLTNVHGNKVLILDPASHGRMCGVVNVNFTKKLGQVSQDTIYSELIKSDAYEADKEYLDAFKSELSEVYNWINEPLGTLSETIYSADAVFGPSSFMKVIHEAQLFGSKGQISIASNLAFNTSLQKGDVTLKELFRLYRYDNDLFTMKLSGKEIDGLIEYAVELRYNTMKQSSDHLMKMEPGYKGKMRLKNKYYGFSEAFGIDYVVDVTKAKGDKVVIKQFSNGSPFYSDSVYYVAMNSYRASGGGGHLTHGAGLSEEEIKLRVANIAEDDIRMIIADYIKSQGDIVVANEQNWQVIPNNWVREAAKRDRELLY